MRFLGLRSGGWAWYFQHQFQFSMCYPKGAHSLGHRWLQLPTFGAFWIKFQIVNILHHRGSFVRSPLAAITHFSGPRGPLRLPLIPVPSRPQQKFQTLSYLFSFNSDSKLTQPIPQNTVHRTLDMVDMDMDPPHPVNWSLTHSTGPQTPFLQISRYRSLKSQKFKKQVAFYFEFCFWEDPLQPVNCPVVLVN